MFYIIRGWEGRYLYDTVSNGVYSISQQRPLTKIKATGKYQLSRPASFNSMFRDTVTVSLAQIKNNMLGGNCNSRGKLAGITAIDRVDATVSISPDADDGQFIIGSIIDNVAPSLSFSANPKVHTTIKAVEAECERLAKINPGKSYVYFKKIRTVVTDGVRWE
jgi:hypothetical protein